VATMFEPEHPCRLMPTRHCPDIYDGVCGPDRPCARYESNDPTPWEGEAAAAQAARAAAWASRTEPRLNWIGVKADPTAGMCACTPTPGIPVNMCLNAAAWHILLVDDDGRLVSLHTCEPHFELAASLGQRVITYHAHGPNCRIVYADRRTILDTESGLSHCEGRI
jgi:hypothetical protein